MRSQFILAFGSSLVFAATAFGQNWINPAGGSWGCHRQLESGTRYRALATFNLEFSLPGMRTLPFQ